MPLPGLSLGLSSNASSGVDGTVSSRSTAGSGGFRLSPLVNIAFPGANLSAAASADGSPKLPAFVLWVVGLVLVGLGVAVWRKRKGAQS